MEAISPEKIFPAPEKLDKNSDKYIMGKESRCPRAPILSRERAHFPPNYGSGIELVHY